jgi:hypothetical protein
MARMLGAARPGYRRECRYRRKGCTCFVFHGEHGRKAKVLRRRAQRAREKGSRARLPRA